MIRDMIMQMASKDPSLTQGVDAMEAQLQRTPIVPEDMDEAIKLLEYVIQNPDKYKAIRAAAIKDGLIDESTFPPEYDQTMIVSLLIAMYGLQDRLKQRGFSRGGLSVAGRGHHDRALGIHLWPAAGARAGAAAGGGRGQGWRWTHRVSGAERQDPGLR